MFTISPKNVGLYRFKWKGKPGGYASLDKSLFSGMKYFLENWLQIWPTS